MRQTVRREKRDSETVPMSLGQRIRRQERERERGSIVIFNFFPCF